jgi:hypothetical protein
MRVRGNKKRNPQNTTGAKAATAASYAFQAPVRGLIMNDTAAAPDPAGASVLNNWWPTTRGAKVRGGSVKYATLPDAVQTLITYKSGGEWMFAATGDSIYDITTVADPDVSPTAAVTGRTSGDYCAVQYGTAGGDYMILVNGSDDALLYDGTTFADLNDASSPAITGVDTSALTHAWSHGSRIWFVEGGTMNAWYLPADSIAGAAAQFSLAGVFRKGGSLLFGASWSLDAGDGLDDKCVFVSTEGEVLIYEGTDPTDYTTWSLAGVYTMPKPISRRSHIQAGGDLLVATEVGLIPVSAAITTDLGAIETKSVSRPITPYWQSKAMLSTSNWEISRLDDAGVMVITQPPSGSGYSMLAVNMMTGAWSKVTGWAAQTLATYGGDGYFGTDDGEVFLMNVSGSDNGTPYTASYVGQYENLGAFGILKTIRQMRASFLSGSLINPQLTALTDYGEDLPSPTSSAGETTTDVWDVGKWDEAEWDAGTTASYSSEWVSVGRTGNLIAPCVQLTFGTNSTPDVEIVAVEAQYHTGAQVT